MAQDWKKVIIVHGHAASQNAKTEITGSFAKLIGTGSANTSILDVIEFGNMTQPESKFTASFTATNFNLPEGAHIDGPIARFRVKSGSAGVLAYVK